VLRVFVDANSRRVQVNDEGLIAAAAVGAGRGIAEYEPRTWPVGATMAGVGLTIAVELLADRPQIPVASAATLALLGIVLAERRHA